MKPNGHAIERQTYSIEEVAIILGLSRNAAYVAARTNQLPVPAFRVGKRMFVSKAALDRFFGSMSDAKPDASRYHWDDDALDAEESA